MVPIPVIPTLNIGVRILLPSPNVGSAIQRMVRMGLHRCLVTFADVERRLF